MQSDTSFRNGSPDVPVKESVRRDAEGFETWTVRREWRVIRAEVDQYGKTVSEVVLSTWPTRDQARADRINHGERHEFVTGRWVPLDDNEYAEIQVVCADVRLPETVA